MGHWVNSRAVSFSLIFLILIISGCSNYVIIHDLQTPLESPPTCFIDIVRDGMSSNVKEGDKPSPEDIAILRSELFNELTDRNFFRVVSQKESVVLKYKLTPTIIDYKKGSQLLRYFTWFGHAKITANLELTDTKSGKVVFSGNFSGSVTDYRQSGKMIYMKVAENFAKALRKRMTKLTGNKY